MNHPVAIALDLGTTSIKAGLLNENGELQTVKSLRSPAVENNGAFYESDALEYLRVTEKTLNLCLSGDHENTSLGISCQRSSFLVWESDTGLPVSPLISWQDTRAKEICIEFRSSAERITNLTGLCLTPYYFSPKLLWMLRHYPDWKHALTEGVLCVGTLETFIVWRWTQGRYYRTDLSMAARTLLVEYSASTWSEELCDLFGISPEYLPVIGQSTGLDISLDNGCILRASIADQSAALFASGANDSSVVVNLGTGGFVSRYIARKRIVQYRPYLASVVCKDHCGKVHFSVEGTVNSFAPTLEKYPVGQCDFSGLAEIENVMCIAEPSGIGAPYYRADIGQTFSGPVIGLNKKVVTALLIEGFVFRINQIIRDFYEIYPIDVVILSGGLANITVIQQAIAACSPAPVYLLKQTHASLFGIAQLAADLTQTQTTKLTKVEIPPECGKLQRKYNKWRLWIDKFIQDREPFSREQD